MRKSTTTQFIETARTVHGLNKYDYSKVNYIINCEKVIITCLKHGDFSQTPANHLLGIGCPECKREFLSKIRLSTNEEFIKKANLKHNDKYEYSFINYIGTKNKVIITCPEHGNFEQQPNNHLFGQGCPKCRN